MSLKRLIMPFLSIFHIFIIHLMVNALSEEKIEENNKKYFFRYILSYLLVAFFSTIIQKPIFNLLTSYIAIFIISNNYSNDLVDKAFNALYIDTILLIAEFVSGTLLGYANIIPIKNIEIKKVTDLFLMQIFNYAAALILIKAKKEKYNEINNLVKYYLFVVPILSSILLIFFFSSEIIKPIQTSILTIFLLLINVITYKVYTNTVKIITFRKNKEAIDQQNSFYKNQLKLMKENEEAIKSYRHDIKNHLTVLNLLIAQNENDKAKKYIKEMCDVKIVDRKYILSGNEIIDNIVNYKLNLAKNEKIEVDTDISVSKDLFLPSYDITVILGNLLDNAIEACKKLDEHERKIILKINENKSKLTIYIQNNFNRNLKISDEKFITTKNAESEHGYGITNIKKAVKKNKGIYEFDIVDENIFAVLIIFMED